MLHIKIDLVPMGQEEGRKQISELFIHNIRRVDNEFHEYEVCKKDPRFPANKKQKKTTVYHNRKDGCDALVAIAFTAWEDL